ncbi:YidB family protein [Mesorhizobium sp. AaZ16]|uniref:YidB family protein n=1 Tax=Mesorhizobium sp. AaZ16 TaxID=3402289 RepID=UPI00374ED41B
MANLGKVALAMLGILAYQNRDKIGELLRGSDRTGMDRENPQQADGGGLIEQITDTLGSGGGLADVLDRFRQSGSGEQADSWIRQGPNQPVDRQQVEAAIDPETINELSLQTGLSREELLERIAHDLPDAVDKMTPSGHLPDEAANAKPAEPILLDPVPPRTQ